MNPSRSLGLGLALAAIATSSGRAQAAEPSITHDQLVVQLTAALDSLASRDEFSGVVALGKNGVIVYQRAVGLADREARRSNNPETAFNLGSINKVFTAIAIRQLAAAGKLDLDSTLARAWPEYPNADVARRVTIQQILQMRSGIQGDIFADPPTGGNRASIRRLRDYLPLFVNEPLEFEPGTRQQYSNAGYIVLGLLVEKLSGEDYYDYVRRHIYEPAGMLHTAHYPSDSLPPNTAVGYSRGPDPSHRDGPPQRNTTSLPGRGSSAGGGYSTAADMMRFVQALRDNRIPGGGPAGLGVAGGAPGLNATLDGSLPGGYDLIIMANMDPPAAQLVARRIRGWLGARS